VVPVKSFHNFIDLLKAFPLMTFKVHHEIEANGGISRRFVKSFADGDIEELFIASMMFGFGDSTFPYPDLMSILVPPLPRAELEAIRFACQSNGPGAGWNAMMGDHHVHGMGYAFGTKFLWAAGYDSPFAPHPLILDSNVLRALSSILGSDKWRPEMQPSLRDYENYLDLAAAWSLDQTWMDHPEPELVEFSLFEYGKILKR